MAHLFPIYLDLSGKKCLVIGGGPVAERKVENLLDYGVNIKLVSPQVEKKIEQWAEDGIITWLPREFEETDLKEVFIVFVATNDGSVNQTAVELCRQKGILANAVDDPPNCDFFIPSIIRRDSLVVAISTEGKSPLFARRLREELEQVITPEYGEFVTILGEMRIRIKEIVPDIELRKKIFQDLVDSDILILLKAGEKQKARERIEQCMSSWLA
ncbi:MAG: bifunctional precorrin-2 dehydrogenase/sirohydrochlorin ferrochelatase [Syntrophomonadaceae bacterium]|nr:bifunctional precorrin-2 dehydrogenase/sirohydrochlorin ferrochelatase [Syntrophomonadaceae bacterium]MDD3023471.1 bifunctional precorrin-2 dehydrogenase/sirohydrochlorin ferrochelatase [Syntrophomonadaceae bacterium]